MASSRFVLPAPFAPANAVTPRENASRTSAYERKSSSARSLTRTSGGNAERHHDVQVAVVPDDLDDARREWAAELELDLGCGQAAEGVGDEARVEGDRRVLSL